MVSLRLGRKYNCIQEVMTSDISPKVRGGAEEEEEDGTIINNNNRSGSGSFFCIITLFWAKRRDYSRGICRADQESTVPSCRVKKVMIIICLVRLQSSICLLNRFMSCYSTIHSYTYSATEKQMSHAYSCLPFHDQRTLVQLVCGVVLGAALWPLRMRSARPAAGHAWLMDVRLT
jgi:hypothetical protein